MDIKEFEKWVNTPSREIFTSSSEELQWAIQRLKLLEDICFDLGIELAELKGEPSPYWGT